MEIYFEQLREYAQSFVECLGRHDLMETRELELWLNRRLHIPGKKEFVLVHKRPSNGGTEAYKLSYTLVNPSTIPLEVVLNPSLEYGQIFLKCRQHVYGYFPFAWDVFENGTQAKPFNPADLNLAKAELEALTNLGRQEN